VKYTPLFGYFGSIFHRMEKLFIFFMKSSIY